MGRSTAAEIEKRTLAIYELITQGYTNNKIVEFCRQTYGINTRQQAYSYIKKATKRIHEEINDKLRDAKGEATARYLKLFDIAFEKEDYEECRKIQARLDKINGLEIMQIKAEQKIDYYVIPPKEKSDKVC